MPNFEVPGGDKEKGTKDEEKHIHIPTREEVLLYGGKAGTEIIREKENKKRRIVALARELVNSREKFSFPGLDPESYARLKYEEKEFPGYATPIDELIERFKSEGMKIVFGNDPENGTIHILPSGSDDVENDSVLPWSLQVGEDMDERLSELIGLRKK